jgi:hypothetical protein
MNSFSDAALDDDEYGRLCSTEAPVWTKRDPPSTVQCGVFWIKRLSGTCRDDGMRVGGTPDRRELLRDTCDGAELPVGQVMRLTSAGLFGWRARERLAGQQTHL